MLYNSPMPSASFFADPRRAEYAARFNRVVDHIQAHLGEPMDLETLAGVACFSPYHFHRLFRGWMGETLHDFIFRLRVERASAQLAYSPRKTISEVALDCGFSSPATFARAFRTFHGMSASEWRRHRHPYPPPVQDGTGTPRGRVFSMPLKVEVRHLPPRPVAYIRHVGPYQEDAALFAWFQERIRGWARERGLLLPAARLLSITHDAPEITDAQKLRLDVAITVPEGTIGGGEIGTRVLAGGTYAVARARIQTNQFIEAWDTLMGGWMPSSGYQPDDRPRFEFYLNEPVADPDGWIEVEICLAVRPM